MQQLGLQVSHETIYAVLYALPRGELRRAAARLSARGQGGARPQADRTERRCKSRNMTNIREHPSAVEGRLVPGHQEGDLIVGPRNASAIGTLVERNTRYLLLVAMPTCKAAALASAFEGALCSIPAPLRRTLTYDQSKDMAEHESLARATGMKIFFADPHSPWQRGPTRTPMACCGSIFPRACCLPS